MKTTKSKSTAKERPTKKQWKQWTTKDKIDDNQRKHKKPTQRQMNSKEKHIMGVCKNPVPIRLVFHDPPWAIFSFHSKNDKRKKNDNVGYMLNDLCPDSWNPSSWKPHTGFTNDNKTITKMITFGIKNGPCETLPFFPFPLPFLSLSFFLSLPLLFLFILLSFFLSLFPFLFRFLSVPFSFRFPFAFFVLSLSFPFPFPFFTLPFPFPFLAHVNSLIKAWSQRLKQIRGKKTITSGNTIWKGSGFLQTSTWKSKKN